MRIDRSSEQSKQDEIEEQTGDSSLITTSALAVPHTNPKR